MRVITKFAVYNDQTSQHKHTTYRVVIDGDELFVEEYKKKDKMWVKIPKWENYHKIRSLIGSAYFENILFNKEIRYEIIKLLNGIKLEPEEKIFF